MKKFKCPFSRDHVYVSKNALLAHIGSTHGEELNDLSPAQVYFNFNNKYPLYKKYGASVISGKPTQWNESKGKYERFADEADKEAYRRDFLKKMNKRYGKDHILDDMDVQKKMLANRKISGVYKFSDGTEKTYTGSYEHDFLRIMDLALGWNGKDIFAPAPQVLEYYDPKSKKNRLYIPDFWIADLNLLVEIKSSENKHFRARDIESEKAKDKVAEKSSFNFVKVYDKDYDPLIQAIVDILQT